MPSILPERPSVPQLKARIFKASNGCGSGFVAAGVMARGATQKQALLQCCFGPAPRLVSSKPVSPLQQHTTTKSGSCYTLPRQHYHYPFPSSLSRNLNHFFEFHFKASEAIRGSVMHLIRLVFSHLVGSYLLYWHNCGVVTNSRQPTLPGRVFQLSYSGGVAGTNSRVPTGLLRVDSPTPFTHGRSGWTNSCNTAKG